MTVISNLNFIDYPLSTNATYPGWTRHPSSGVLRSTQTNTTPNYHILNYYFNGSPSILYHDVPLNAPVSKFTWRRYDAPEANPTTFGQGTIGCGLFNDIALRNGFVIRHAGFGAGTITLHSLSGGVLGATALASAPNTSFINNPNYTSRFDIYFEHFTGVISVYQGDELKITYAIPNYDHQNVAESIKHFAYMPYNVSGGARYITLAALPGYITTPSQQLVLGTTVTVQGASLAGVDGTITLGSETIPATVNGDQINFLLPVLRDGMTLPLLPSDVPVPVSFTAEGLTVDFTANIELPPSLSHEVFGIVNSTNPLFLGHIFEQHSQPLQTGDRIFYDSNNGRLVFYPDSRIATEDAFFQTTIYIQRAATGTISSHVYTNNSTNGEVGFVIDASEWYLQSTSPRFDGNHPKSLRV